MEVMYEKKRIFYTILDLITDLAKLIQLCKV